MVCNNHCTFYNPHVWGSPYRSFSAGFSTTSANLCSGYGKVEQGIEKAQDLKVKPLIQRLLRGGLSGHPLRWSTKPGNKGALVVPRDDFYEWLRTVDVLRDGGTVPGEPLQLVRPGARKHDTDEELGFDDREHGDLMVVEEDAGIQ